MIARLPVTWGRRAWRGRCCQSARGSCPTPGGTCSPAIVSPRLVAQGPVLVYFLVGVTMDRQACAADAVLSQQTGLGADHIKRYLLVLRQMGTCSGPAEKVDFGERLTLLDAACRVARTGPGTIWRLEADAYESPDARKQVANLPESSLHWDASASVDWNEVLTLLNARVDRLVAALKTSDLPGRDQALAGFGREMAAAEAASNRHFTQPQNIALLRKGMIPEGTTPTLFTDWLSCLSLPNPSPLVSAEGVGTTHWRLGQLALALAAYREHQSYPPSLAELAPAYIEEVPKDPFSESDFHYQLKPDSYVLYGVGPNRRDDGGRGRARGGGRRHRHPCNADSSEVGASDRSSYCPLSRPSNLP